MLTRLYVDNSVEKLIIKGEPAELAFPSRTSADGRDQRSIREVQPWLSELERVLDERGAQAIIVSHGTEAMNYLGSRQAFVVTRPDGGATRIAPHDSSDGSMPSEVVLYGVGSEAGASK